MRRGCTANGVVGTVCPLTLALSPEAGERGPERTNCAVVLTTDALAFRQVDRQSGWAIAAVLWLANLLWPWTASAELKTWDGKHSIEKIEVTAVYFVPKDRSPLPDWKDRLSYFCRRIERFHEREFQGQSALKTVIRPEPYRSEHDSQRLIPQFAVLQHDLA
jgi:hypothetical protein